MERELEGKIEDVLQLSPEAESRVEQLKMKYPQAKSAIMPILFIAQEELGWIDERAVVWVASRLDLSPAQVRAVATFYTMYYKKPVGKYHIQICRTLSCMLCGGKGLTEELQAYLGLAPGEVSQDGMWSYEEVECLGSCGSGPMIEINDVYFENLSREKLKLLLERIKKEQPDLRYSTKDGELGGGLSGFPFSAVWTERKNGQSE